MSRFAVLLALSISWLAPEGVAFPALRTVAELAELSAAACADGHPFSVTGKVECTLASSAYILSDATGRMHFRQETGTLPAAGTIAVVSGFTTNYSPQRIFFVTNAALIVRRPPDAPIAANMADILNRRLNYRSVTVSGTVVDAAADDINTDWDYLVIRSNGDRLVAAVPTTPRNRLDQGRLLNAEVALRGVVLPDHCGQRCFVGPHLELARAEDITILSPPAPLFDAPRLRMSDVFQMRPEEIADLPPRTVCGRVLAAWGDGNLILKVADDDDRCLRIHLISGQPSPPVGATIEIVGRVGTNVFNLRLAHARWRPAAGESGVLRTEAPLRLTAAHLNCKEGDRLSIDSGIDNCSVSFEGTIVTAPTPSADGGRRITVNCGDYSVQLEIDPLREAGAKLCVGDVIRATGIAVIETDEGRPSVLIPSIRCVTVIARSPDDVLVVAHAPWWTPFRLFLVILALLTAIVVLAIASLVLRRLVERRSLQLAAASLAAAQSDIKTLERTRLATELHDSISQTLTGVSLEIEAARRHRNNANGDVLGHLEVAANTLQSCRSELRNCLWDLRSQAIDEPTVEAAVRRTLAPHLANVSLDLRIGRIGRMELPETTLHAVLRIVRELTVNAIRHGKATRVTIESRRDSGRIFFSVTDDGSGFDPDRTPGIDNGHFGLQGIRERLALLNGTFSISSATGRGTHAEFSVSAIDDSNATTK